MNALKMIVVSAMVFGLGACAQTATQADFGGSVKNMIAEQTANPDAEASGPESGDGARLEGVVDNYRGVVSDRSDVKTTTGLGVPQG